MRRDEYDQLRAHARPLTGDERWAVGLALHRRALPEAVQRLTAIWGSIELAEAIVSDWLWWAKGRTPTPPPELAFSVLPAAA